VLLPEVRKTDTETLIITNGFSCHEQIFQQAKRPALHLAQVLQLAMHEGKIRAPEPAPAPEAETHVDGEAAQRHSGKRWAIAGATAAAAGAAGALYWSRHR